MINSNISFSVQKGDVVLISLVSSFPFLDISCHLQWVHLSPSLKAYHVIDLDFVFKLATRVPHVDMFCFYFLIILSHDI